MRNFVALFAIVGLATSTFADVDPNSGIDFTRIGNTGNAAYQGPESDGAANGRGGVSYEYQIGKTEVTTAQWMEFYNAVISTHGPGSMSLPIRWGAGATGNPNQPFALLNANSGTWPVSGVSWRTAAYFCNWLHNNKQADLASLTNGAYDTSTFGYNGGVFTDQAAHHPNARYWIPTLDEWIKAAFYDPTKNGGVGGYWLYPNAADTPLTYGPPGQGQANSGFNLPGDAQFRIPLMSYDTASYYGMRDAAGGTREWTESILTAAGAPFRMVHGSGWATVGFTTDRINRTGALFPDSEGTIYGFRIAAAIPAPSTSGILLVMIGVLARRRRRSIHTCAEPLLQR